MNQSLTTFQFHTFILEVIERDGSPWFIARPLAEFLGYKNPSEAIRDNCDKEDVATSYIPSKSNNYICVNESGLYSLIIRSDKPDAKKFKRWVTSEVLPSIRKTGSYSIRPKTALELAREQVALLEHIDKVERERDCAIATKAEIGSRREATAMNTASQERKRANRLEAELDRSKQYYSIKRMEMLHHGQKFNWRHLKSTGIEMGIEPIDIFDANYGTVKAYHIDVWREAYAIGSDFDSHNEAA
jgi:prophage antirepressor-like protein